MERLPEVLELGGADVGSINVGYVCDAPQRHHCGLLTEAFQVGARVPLRHLNKFINAGGIQVDM